MLKKIKIIIIININKKFSLINLLYLLFNLKFINIYLYIYIKTIIITFHLHNSFY